MAPRQRARAAPTARDAPRTTQVAGAGALLPVDRAFEPPHPPLKLAVAGGVCPSVIGKPSQRSLLKNAASGEPVNGNRVKFELDPDLREALALRRLRIDDLLDVVA